MYLHHSLTEEAGSLFGVSSVFTCFIT